jgi:hypothetical protein
VIVKFFQQLGRLVEERWRARNYDETAFHEIAFQALRELPPVQHVAYEQVIEWAFRTPDLPQQNNIEFGQPPITLYRTSRFYIEALFWMEATTSIHQHAFYGAFQLLAGSSIHCRYEFKLKERVNVRFLIGDVRLKKAEYLSRGDSRMIFPGDRFIHSIFHLDQPSVTIVVRTFASRDLRPQYDYFKPCLAYDPFSEDLFVKHRLQLLNVLRQSKHPDFLRFATDLLSTSDLEFTFRILEQCYCEMEDNCFAHLFETARARQGQILDLFMPVFEEIRRSDYIFARRAKVTDPHHRFFLALLLNLPDRDHIFRFIKSRYQEDPRKKITQWVRELSRLKVADGAESSALGIRLDDLSLIVFESLLEGLSLQALKKRLKQEYRAGDVDAKSRELDQLRVAFQKAIPLKPLFC